MPTRTSVDDDTNDDDDGTNGRIRKRNDVFDDTDDAQTRVRRGCFERRRRDDESFDADEGKRREHAQGVRWSANDADADVCVRGDADANADVGERRREADAARARVDCGAERVGVAVARGGVAGETFERGAKRGEEER